ncbi:MAG: OsmC family protein [Gemmatimonadota bacterium]|jgi:putative redox protein|nr:OsmC family protein [Gemmatimonadota bacterium]
MLEGEKVPYPVEVVWEGEKRFRGGVAGVTSILIDGSRTEGPSPVDSILVSVASCSGIDLVDILEKRRTPVLELSIRVEFSRAPTPPKRLTRIDTHYRVVTGSERHHVVRALELSYEKYCSVTASLAPDTEINWSVDVFSPSGERVVG